MTADMIYLADDLESTVDRILDDKELAGLGLNRMKVKRTLKSFRGDEIAASVFLKKYALRDADGKVAETTLEEAKERWAEAVAGAEKRSRKQWAERFRALYDYFLPAGRQMFALNNDNIKKKTLTNCYVTKIADDSIEGIYGGAQNIAKTFSYGGGIGLCIGELRPRGAKVSNSALFSTGAVSFMDLFSLTSGLIGQSFRRGALMITIPVDHPDIEEFVEIKHGNTEKVKYANISIKLTDEFMRAVEDDKPFRLAFSTKHEAIEKTVRARDLWRRIVTSARDSAEPGLMFWDRMVEMSPSEIYEGLQVHSTNPCVTGETLVATPYGWKRADAIHVGDLISTVTGSGAVQNIETHRGVPVYEAEFSDGTCLTVTAAHQFYVAKKDPETGKYPRKYTPTRLDQMEVGDFVRISPFETSMLSPGTEEDFKDGLRIGVLLGAPKTAARGVAKVASDDRDVKWNSIVTSLFSEKSISLFRHGSTDESHSCNLTSQDGSLVALISEYGLPHAYSHEKEIPSQHCTNMAKIRGVLNGLFSTDGNVNLSGDTPQIRLKSTSWQMLNQVKQLLLMFGVFSTLWNAGKTEDILGRKVHSHDRFELVIGGQSVESFIKHVGISHPDKKARCDELLLYWALTGNTWRTKLKAVRPVGCATVYDIFEPTTDTWITNGVVSRGCGEQILEPGGACVLGSMLLDRFVDKPFTPEASFDYDRFENMVAMAVRHLDNVVTLNMGKHALSEQEAAAENGRRIGLGVTGLADMLAALGLRYDSEEALQVVDGIMRRKKEAEYTASIVLASERGSFGKFDPERHYTRGFPAHLPDDIKRMGRAHGQRNVAISTIAPSGSLSIIAQCSSGIEPVFALRYKRYVELGDERKEFEVHHQGVARFMRATGAEELPACWVTAHQIWPQARIKMQAVLQKHVDASISSTINLPEDVDVDTVADIYMEAWKAGLKGVTVYREGSREGILITDEYAQKAGRPLVDTVVHKVRAEGGDKFYIPVSYRGGDLRKPYQVFILNYKATENDRLIKLGNDLVRMIRNAGVCEKRIEKYLSRSKNSLSKVTRFSSLALKANLLKECVEILDQHAFAGTLAAELHNIFARSLAIGKLLCKECGSHNVRHEEGCKRCLDCGWTGCG